MGLLFSKDKYFAEYKIHNDYDDVRYNLHGHIPQMEMLHGYVQERRVEQSGQEAGAHKRKELPQKKLRIQILLSKTNILLVT